MRTARADEVIWSGLVLATNEAKPMAPPGELTRFAPGLRSVFGYNQIELIGSHLETIDDPAERWLIPSKRFCLRVTAKSSDRGTHLLTIQLFQDDKLLVETKAELNRKSPLFIRGPMYGNGQLIVVLAVK